MVVVPVLRLLLVVLLAVHVVGRRGHGQRGRGRVGGAGVVVRGVVVVKVGGAARAAVAGRGGRRRLGVVLEYVRRRGPGRRGRGEAALHALVCVGDVVCVCVGVRGGLEDAGISPLHMYARTCGAGGGGR